VNYFPNSLDGGHPKPAPLEEGGYVHYMEKVEGRKIRDRSESFRDFFSQAKLFWNSLSQPEKKHLVNATHFELGKVESKEVRERMVALFNQVDGDLAKQAAMGIGVEPPAEPGGVQSSKSSPAVSMENTVKNTVKSRKVAILAADGFNADELSMVKDGLKKAGASVKVISMYLGTLKGVGGGEVMVDKNYVSTASVLFDALYIPGGKESVETLKTHGEAKHFVNEMFKHCKPIAAMTEGVELFKDSSIVGVNYVESGKCGEIVSDKGVVTACGPLDMDAFVKTFCESIAKHRHWDREEKKMVPA
jgi:catalase